MYTIELSKKISGLESELHLYTLNSFPPGCSEGLGSSIGRASHRRCECVCAWVQSLKSREIFFCKKENLGTCIQVL